MNAICDLLSIKYPVFQGGMAWVSNASLASAVSNAGGLGIIASANAPADYVQAEIKKAKALTDKPFGVNVMLLSPFVEDVAQVVIDEKVAVVTTGAGLPTRYMKAWLEAGIKVIPVVPSIAVAKFSERAGACAVIAEGCESGGHIGELTTMTLVPQICDAVNIPVIAAGGICDGRGMAAAICLGAVGIQMGTAFLVANECTVHKNYKDLIIKAKEIDTIATGRRLGHPVRALKSRFTREFYKYEYSSITDAELEKMGEGVLRLAAVEGDIINGCFMAGQTSGMIQKERSASDIIEGVLKEAEIILRGNSVWVK